MILLILLQLFQVDSTRSLINNLYHREAYQLIRSVDMESLSELNKCEVLELKGLTAINERKFKEAKSIYFDVFECEYPEILSKAYINYADLLHKQFDFDGRLTYLKKAYHKSEKTYRKNQAVRIITKHLFKIEADYERAEQWLKKHTIPVDAIDSSGYFSTLAQLNEAKRQYEQAIEYYYKAKISAQEANLFNYELFASEGIYRSERLLDAKQEEKMINWITWFILGLVIYYYVKKIKKSYVRIDQSKDKSRHLNY